MNLLLPVFVIGAVMMAAGTASAGRRRRRVVPPSPMPPLPTPSAQDVFTDCPLESYGLSSTVSDRIRTYAAAVEAAALEFGLDPDLLMGHVMVESTWNPDAESSAGAVGLLQIIPSTGEWISQQSGLVDDRRDPYNNLRMGAWLVRYLYEKWDGDLTLALAAYFAGSGNVQKALDDTGTLKASYANYANAVFERQDEFVSIREFCVKEAA